MRQTIESIQQTAVELDRHFAASRIIPVVAALAITEVLSGAIIVAAHEGEDKHGIVLESHVDNDLSRASTLNESSTSFVPPQAVTLPKKAAVPHNKSTQPHATSINTSMGYRQIVLQTAPRITTEKVHFSQLLVAPDAVEKVVADISYPQCESQTAAEKLADKRQGSYNRVTDHVKTSLKFSQFDYLIIGANGGRNFRSNRCLKEELALTVKGGVSQPHGIYVNSGYPGYTVARQYRSSPNHCKTADKICVARNFGIQAARYAVLAVSRAGGYAPDTWAIDVETANSWKGTAAEHVANLKGMEEALRAASPSSRILYYSVPSRAATSTKDFAPGMWGPLTGNWRPANAGSWIAGGNNNAEDALRSCTSRPSLTKTQNQLSQYVHNGIDYNVICPKQ